MPKRKEPGKAEPPPISPAFPSPLRPLERLPVDVQSDCARLSAKLWDRGITPLEITRIKWRAAAEHPSQKRQQRWAPRLEEEKAQTARLVTKRCMVTDHDAVPILCYMPKQLPDKPVTQISGALVWFMQIDPPKQTDPRDPHHPPELEVQGVFKRLYGIFPPWHLVRKRPPLSRPSSE